MKPFNIIYCSLTIIGSIIGAGFITGKELIVFFGGLNSFSVISAFILFFAFIFVVSVSNNQNVDKLFNPIIAVANFIIVSTMLAGGDSIIETLFSINKNYSLFSSISLILCVYLSISGVEKIEKSMIIFVPVMTIIILLLSCNKIKTCGAYYSFYFDFGFIPYVSMNIFLSSAVIKNLTCELTYKDKLSVSVISSSVLCFLIIVILSAMSKRIVFNCEIPLYELFKNNKYSKLLYSFVVILAILTTLIVSHYTLYLYIKKGKFCCVKTVVFSFLAFVFSKLGFSVLVSKIYPIIGFLGFSYLIINFFSAIFSRLKRLQHT